MASLQQVKTNFKNNIKKSLDVCQFVERGQAQTPLTDLFSRLETDLNNRPFSITLLCLNQESRLAALKWLYGHNFAVFNLEVSSQIGLMEIHLRDRGYSLEKSTGERQDFENWEQLAEAISEARLVKDDGKADIRLGAEARTGVKNLHVLMPESAQFINDSPALMTRLMRETNVLMVVAPPHYSLSDIERQVLDSLLEEMAGFWPLLPVDELSDDINIPEHGWWQLRQPIINMPPTLLTTHVDAKLPSFLTDADDPLRQALHLLQISKKFHSACAAVEDRVEQEIKQLNSRKKREARKGQGKTGLAMPDTGQWSNVRNTISDELAEISRKLQDICRKRELGTSTGSVTLKQHVDSLTPEDLTREDGYKQIKLSLSKKYIGDLMHFLESTNKQALNDDFDAVTKAIKEINDRSIGQMEKIMGYRPQLTYQKLDRNAVWQDVKELIDVELRYQGEMPKRGILDRLSEGRKSAFVVLMSASLLGYMGIDIRRSGWIGIIIFPVFIGGIIYTFKSWKKEDQMRLEKELGRVRDEVLNNARRLLTDVNRVKSNLFGQYLEGVKKSWQQQVEALSHDWQNKIKDESREEVSKAAARVQLIDKQLGEWQRQQSPVQQLQREAESLLSDSRNCVAQLAG